MEIVQVQEDVEDIPDFRLTWAFKFPLSPVHTQLHSSSALCLLRFGLVLQAVIVVSTKLQ